MRAKDVCPWVGDPARCGWTRTCSGSARSRGARRAGAGGPGWCVRDAGAAAVRPRRDRARCVASPTARGPDGAATPACDTDRPRRGARPRIGHDAPDRRAPPPGWRAGGAAGRGPAEPHVPARRVPVPAPGEDAGRGDAGAGTGRVAPRDVRRPPVRRPPRRRHAASGRGARLGRRGTRARTRPRTFPAGSTVTSARSGRSSTSLPDIGLRTPPRHGSSSATSASETAGPWTSMRRTRTGWTWTSTTHVSTGVSARRSRRARSTGGCRRTSSNASSPRAHEIVFVGFSTGLHGPHDVVVPYPSHENHMHVRFRAPG